MKRRPLPFLICCLVIALSVLSCQRKLGWGVLLWATEDIPSGVILPVFVKSNIEKKWIVGIPQKYQTKADTDKAEIPLSQLELFNSKSEARHHAAAFEEYASIYAETMQDGLPIRSNPDNNAPRVYRLRIGEVIKIISLSEGVPAISTTGDPLPGEWYQVLTEEGSRGYCFSYRLRLFEHSAGVLFGAQNNAVPVDDVLLQTIQSKTWAPEMYATMLDSRKFDIDALSKHWGFSTGEDTGVANIYTADIDRSFQYSAIRSTGENSWRFDGTSLTMTLVSDNVLLVRFIDRDGFQKTANFTTLPVTVDDLIAQERNRRHTLYTQLLAQGPEFESAMFGRLVLTEEEDFLWEDFEQLVPDYLPASALGRGKIEIRYNLSDELLNSYTGIVSLRFKTIGNMDKSAHFLYKIGSETEADGVVRFEYLSPERIMNGIVSSTDDIPLIIYFFKML